MDRFFGGLDSLLTTPPSSPRSSRSASPSPSHIAASSRAGRKDQPPASQSNSKKRRDKRRQREKRRLQRQEDALKTPRATDAGYIPRPTTLDKHVLPANPVKTEYQRESMNAASDSSGYGARREKNPDAVYSLQELLEVYKFQYIPWDGRTAKPILDGEDRIIAAFTSVEQARGKCAFPRKAQDHRRGAFSALSYGISHDGGQTEPGNLKHTPRNEKQLEIILFSKDPFTRIAGFANRAFSTGALGYIATTSYTWMLS
ncbi:hypothetical protein D9613_010363 [Agrocybe pediades]|uniref:Uncharacterized protein n=1 Tax=Agrocybe pediades TaxID=84607 RepID=A0A8H4QGB6_9AGAR|nr:hypothetical protein D9613_010363 [Agrocybe pediades]